MCARRETARRALHRQQGERLAATDQYEAAARKNFVKTLARNTEAHNDNVQVQVRQLEHEADARFSQRQMELLSRFSLEGTQALEDQRDRHQKHGDETSKYMIYVPTWVFMHHNRKTLCNNEVDNTLDYISTWQDLLGKHSNVDKCSKNLELLNEPLDQKLVDIDEEKKNFYVKCDATTMTEWKLMLYY